MNELRAGLNDEIIRHLRRLRAGAHLEREFFAELVRKNFDDNRWKMSSTSGTIFGRTRYENVGIE